MLAKTMTKEFAKLHTLNKHAMEGFTAAAKAVDHQPLEDALVSFAHVHKSYMNGIGTYLDEQPGSSGLYEFAGKLHKVWLNLSQAVSGGDPRTVIDECLTGERVTLTNYEEIVEQLDRDDELFTMLNAQYEGVQQLVEKLEQMKATFNA